MRLLADPQRGHLLWTPQEADAYRRVEETRAYMSLTDNVGGYMVPLHLDPAIILSSAGTTNAMRKVATVKQTVSESWQGVTSAGVSAEWIAENTQVAEATPTLAAVPIPVYKGDAFTPFSFEVGMDAVNFQQELAKVLVDAADTLMATAYTTGPGTTAADRRRHRPDRRRVARSTARAPRRSTPRTPTPCRPRSRRGSRPRAAFMAQHRDHQRLRPDGDHERGARSSPRSRTAGSSTSRCTRTATWTG